ncbi:MAG: PKD domain-containing protein [Croceimicrobium sp.]
MSLQRLLFLGFVSVFSFSLHAQCPSQSLPYSENFNSNLGCFTVTDGGTSTDTWVQAGPGGGSTGGDLDGTGLVIVDSDEAGSGETLEEWLISPYIDASSISGTLYLSFDQYFRSIGINDSAYIEVWDSSQWVTIYTNSGTVGAFSSPDQQQIDITNYANDSLQVRFLYKDNGSWAWWWVIDNFKVEEVLCPSPSIQSVIAATDSSFTVSFTGSIDTLSFEWGPVGFSQGTGCIGSIAPNGNSSVTLSNSNAGSCGSLLAAGQCYDVYLTKSCPNGGNSAYVGPFTFCTPCTTVNLPYTENFDLGAGCFTIVDGGTSTDTWRPAPSGGGTSGGDLDGTPHMEVDSDDAGSGETLDEMLVSPLIDASGLSGSLVLEFDQYYNNIGSDSIAVQVHDGSNWNTVYSASSDVGAFNNPDHQYIDITTYANASLQVRMVYRDNGSWAWWWIVDNFSVTEVLCSPSSNFSSSFAGPDSVHLNWIGGTAAGFVIEYGATGFSPGSGTKTNSTSANSMGVNGLSTNTTYDFYLLDSCSGTFSDTIGPLTVSTACLSQSIPYFQNFDNGLACFTVIDGGTTTDTWVHAPAGGLTSGGDLDGTPLMEADSDNAGSGSVVMFETLNSPILDASSYITAGALTLSFDQYYRHLGSGSASVEVFDGLTWNQVANFTATRGAFSAPDSQSIDITPYANANLQVRFIYDDGGSWAWYWLIDNFRVNGQPCGAIASADTISVGTNNINFNWNSANGSLWNINWGPQGFRQGTQTTGGTNIVGHTSSSYNLSGLQANTCYDIYIQDTCAGLGAGQWFGPLTVCTDTSCYAPSNISVSGVGTNSASLSYIAFGTSHQYSLVNSSTAGPSSGTITTTNSLNASISGLNAASLYCVYVRTICAPGDTSAWAGPVCFNTACQTFTAPYLEDFETATSACWQNDYVSGQNDWTIGVGSSGGGISSAYGGLSNAVFTSSSGGPYTTRFVSPIIDASSLSATELSFWYGQESWAGDQNTLTVYYRSSPSGTWTQVWQDINSVSTWTQAIVAIPSNSATLQIAFEGVDDWGRANVLDDVRIDVPGGSVICPQVTNVSASNEDCNSVRLNWLSGSGGSIIEYGPVGFTPGTGSFTAVVSSPFTLSNLMANSSYDVYIADTCGIQDTGAFNGPNLVATNSNGLASAAFTYSSNPNSIFDYSFDASGSTGSIQNYVWDFGDGTVGNGVNVNHTYNTAGAYTVELILVSDCGNDTLTQIIADVSSIEWKTAQLKLYPNPADYSFSLEVPVNEGINIHLRDASGRLIQQWQRNSAANEAMNFDIGDLAEGVYLIEISGLDWSYQERLLVR